MDPEHRTAGTSALGIVAQVSVLVAFWVVLWGSITPGTVLTGILLSVLLLRGGAAHPVPVRPVRILRLLWTLVIEVGLANIAMARAVFRGPERSVERRLRVSLRTVGAGLDAAIALAVTLTPGTIAVGLERRPGTPTVLRLHVLDGTVEGTAASVHRIERRIQEAFGVDDGRVSPLAPGSEPVEEEFDDTPGEALT